MRARVRDKFPKYTRSDGLNLFKLNTQNFVCVKDEHSSYIDSLRTKRCRNIWN